MKKYAIVCHWIVVGLVVLVVSGCGYFSRPEAYHRATESGSLKVPDGLSAPVNESALVVPELETSDVAPAVSPMPPRLARGKQRNSTATNKMSAFLKYDGNLVSLVVKDSIAGAWRRVGFALDRSGAEVISADEAEASYSVRYVSTKALPEGPGFFSRLVLRKKQGLPAERTFQLKISADGERARVKLYGADGYTDTSEEAEELLIKLAERLG